MTEPNYDNRLNPKLRERTGDEVDEFLATHYESFLRGIAFNAIYNVWLKLTDANRELFLNSLVEQLVVQNDQGRKDSDFMKLFTSEEITFVAE